MSESKEEELASKRPHPEEADEECLHDKVAEEIKVEVFDDLPPPVPVQPELPTVKNRETVAQRPRRGGHKFSLLKFRGQFYRVNDHVLIRESKRSNMVAQIVSIIEKGGDFEHPTRPMVELKWFFKKGDLDKDTPGLTPQVRNSLGENEVFDTNFVSKVYADLLNGKCHIWSLSDYDGQAGLGGDDFFWRATYDIQNKLLDPPLEAWERFCRCQMPMNPNEMYVICDNCQQWFHPECVGSSREEARQNESFFCDKCRPSKSSSQRVSSQNF